MSDDLITRLDRMPIADLRAALHTVCSSLRWVEVVSAARPYRHTQALLAAADAASAQLTEADVDEALAGHPRIGERGADPVAHREQARVSGAETLAELAAANREYEARFGHIYLVCADGRTGGELLALLRARLGNDGAAERRVVRDELAKINRLRLRRLAQEDP
ncbi:2-oxo-4-hydroxy-4-carboxy-5-ureidoimidazoline decarboxylase [Rhizohabitans arisaemae]|uniref:2-oxo-4-hydroxy-4-carboxy-5-ureidoimidazoline decarboxylase n=1 Tax=Rhizohabitans arisaemae TaxID=2720610 RepID=UPI0024B229CC|nr:2-oxo-4-hydroxy-4-carboxy-5-ureidoimidazoline decarboxylase [Rhizohabitans arisaemae]